MMKFIFIILVAGGLFCTCSLNPKNDPVELIRISVTTKIPDKIVERQGQTDVITFYVSYYKDYRIFEIPYHSLLEKNNILIYDSIKYHFFIHHNKKSYGYLLDNLTDSFSQRIPCDSILNASAYDGGIGKPGIDFSTMKTILTGQIGDGSKFIYRYIFKDEFYDSAYLHFNSELANIEFSIDKKLDAAYKSKLYKIQFFIKQDSIQKSYNLYDFFISSLEIKPESTKDKQELINCFDRYIIEEKRSQQLH